MCVCVCILFYPQPKPQTLASLLWDQPKPLGHLRPKNDHCPCEQTQTNRFWENDAANQIADNSMLIKFHITHVLGLYLYIARPKMTTFGANKLKQVVLSDGYVTSWFRNKHLHIILRLCQSVSCGYQLMWASSYAHTTLVNVELKKIILGINSNKPILS